MGVTMKNVIFALLLFFSFLFFSCDKIPPATTPIPESISANSVVIKWKSVGDDCHYYVECTRPNVQDWWVDNEQGYYNYYLGRDNPQFLIEAQEYSDSIIEKIGWTQETSVRFDNLEKSTIYSVGVLTNWISGGLGNSDGRLYFRTKDE
jgi:hypothetical protein